MRLAIHHVLAGNKGCLFDSRTSSLCMNKALSTDGDPAFTHLIGGDGLGKYRVYQNSEPGGLLSVSDCQAICLRAEVNSVKPLYSDGDSAEKKNKKKQTGNVPDPAIAGPR